MTLTGESRTLFLGSTEYISLVVSLLEQGSDRVVAVLQRALAEQLAPYEAWRWLLWLVFGVGLLLSAALAILIARSSTRPLRAPARSARRIQEGDYAQRVEVSGRDEIGVLARSFNDMARGLDEKERVRTLLGKVVSGAVAEELFSREIELGGEERVVTYFSRT